METKKKPSYIMTEVGEENILWIFFQLGIDVVNKVRVSPSPFSVLLPVLAWGGEQRLCECLPAGHAGKTCSLALAYCREAGKQGPGVTDAEVLQATRKPPKLLAHQHGFGRCSDFNTNKSRPDHGVILTCTV